MRLMNHATAPRKPPTNMRDVATLARVSVATVSNVLNNPALVAVPTRDRVFEAIEKLGWVRNESARQLRAGRSRFIGLVVIDVSNPFFTDVSSGAEAAAAAAGYVVLVANSGQDPNREEINLDLFQQQRVGGLLVAPIWDLGDKIRDLRRLGIPVVLVDRSGDVRNCCAVSVDDVVGGEMAVGHLIERGHRRIAFVGGPITLTQVKERRDGAIRAMSTHRLGAESLHVTITDHLNNESGRLAARDIAAISARSRPSAVFAANDLVAMGLMQEFIAMGFEVPDDFSIIGYDDIDYAASTVVPLSSIRQPRFDLGHRAAELLLDEIRAHESGETHRHQQVRFTPELVVRASTGVDRVNNHRDRRARTTRVTGEQSHKGHVIPRSVSR
jgi:LacI family transcriptional regulator